MWYNQRMEDRFWSKVRKSDGCWDWTGAKDGSGYGSFHFGGRSARAHRVAYELANGPIPADAHLLHTCDNPGCVRPDHLVPGNRFDNMRDASAKGRMHHGERNGQARLSGGQVMAIRERYAAGDVTQARLGQEFGIWQGHVGRIVRGEEWSHLPTMDHRSRVKITPAMATEIRARFESGERVPGIAAAFGIHRRHAWDLAHGLSGHRSR